MSISFPILLVSFAILQARAIDQQCAVSSDCPTNAVCENSYCRCNIPYILDCLVSAPLLTQNYQQINVSNSTIYYQTQSQAPNVYYDFMFQLCSVVAEDNYNLIFNLWVDTGIPAISSTTNNFVGSVQANLTKIQAAAECIDFVQYQIKLELQPNGQPENLIVGLEIQPISQSDAVNNSLSSIQMRVVTKDIISSDLLLKLSIGIVSAGVFIVLCAIVFCCYRRWKKKKADEEKLNYKQQMVQKFKEMTPEVQAKTLLIPSMTTCSICLGDYQPTQKVRKIICKHIFHSECIESWCLKSLSCPVCRLDLDQQSLKNKKKQIQMSDINWQQNSLSAREGLLDDSSRNLPTDRNG